MGKEVYELRVSDCVIPIKGVLNYIRRVNNAGKRNESMVEGNWKDSARHYTLALSQAIMTGASIIAITKGIEFLVK